MQVETAARTILGYPVIASRDATASDAGDLRGLILGEYRVEGHVAEGGMASIYAAVHPVIDKRAAVKVLHHGLLPDAEAFEQLVVEARAVNQIRHNNIVDIFACGRLPDGRPYLIMEWLEGETLGARLVRGRPPLDEVLDVLDSICRALEAAHAAGVVHRDLKPDNVFLTSTGNDKPLVKLLDFGIAKLHEHDRLTELGALGTPTYMPPEQARGEAADDKADVYALGVLAYELFLGQPPFLGDVATVITAHLHRVPPAPSTLWAAIPIALERLLLQMLEKARERRPKVAHVRSQLAEIAATIVGTPERSLPAQPRPAVVRRRITSRRIAIVAAPLTLAAGFLLALALWPSPRRAQPAVRADNPFAQPLAELAASLRGELIVESTTPGAKVTVDGSEVAIGERYAVDTLGLHEVIVTAPGYEPMRKQVEARANVLVTVPVDLVASKPRRARVHALDKPPSAALRRSLAAPSQPEARPPRSDRDRALNPFATPVEEQP